MALTLVMMRAIGAAGASYSTAISSSRQSETHAQTVAPALAVGDYPLNVAYDSARGEVFVTNYYASYPGNGTVSVIS